MDPPSYPYPRMDEDGYELAVIEQEDTSTVLAAPLPSDDERFAAKSGQTDKLVFQYREPDRRENGAEIGAELMWVRITEDGEGCLVGELDSSPQHTKLLKSEDTVAFHPKHIVSFWTED
ncbi:MAG: DUF2314 domain-containing protein [Verrucomicrobiota bacterium]